MIWLAVIALGACNGASVRLQLSNDTSAVRSTTAATGGVVLKFKLIAAYLTEDVDPITMNNVGATEMIWINPQCADDITGCNVSGYALPSGGPRVTDFFDLARPSADVNAELNSQDNAISPGSYRYARIDMCKAYPGDPPPTDPTLMWRGPGMTSDEPYTSTDCGRTSLAFDPPLEIVAGDSVTVTLGYDLEHAIVAGAPGTSTAGYTIDGATQADGSPHFFRACDDVDATHRVCMDYPDFAPSAAKL